MNHKAHKGHKGERVNYCRAAVYPQRFRPKQEAETDFSRFPAQSRKGMQKCPVYDGHKTKRQTPERSCA